MRPLELTLRGFRSYRTEQIFDWRGRRFVGIVGPIGSGKSSILDAIAFALYGKTPAFKGETRSLIHQLSDECHVRLRFEVDGRVWETTRSLRRTGAAGHQLRQLENDEPDSPAVETPISGARATQEKVEQLLGLDFEAFCRSALLAQGRFAEFLNASDANRDSVLKGVFGYERLDAAWSAAKRELDRVAMELERLAGESRALQDARDRIDEAKTLASSTAARAEELQTAAVRVDELDRSRDDALRRASELAERIGEIARITEDLPSHRSMEETIQAAEATAATVAEAAAEVEAADAASKEADDALRATIDRLGDRDRFESFSALVQRFQQQTQALSDLSATIKAAEGTLEAEEEGLAARRTGEETARSKASAAAAAAEAASAELRVATQVWDEARHAEMAAELRKSLEAGGRCPVCDQPVHKLPPKKAAPKVSAAVRAKSKAEALEAKMVAASNAAGAALAKASAEVRASEEAVAKAGVILAEATAQLERSTEAQRATSAELVEWLGEGDPAALLDERRKERSEAELAAERARANADSARARLSDAKADAEKTGTGLREMADELIAAWGRLKEKKKVGIDPAALRNEYLAITQELLARTEKTEQERSKSEADALASGSALAELFGSLGIDAETGFPAALLDAGGRAAAASQDVERLTATIAAAGDLEARIVATGVRRDVAATLAEDLRPTRFLAYLLEEERASLAELGSEHLEQLTDGAFRFTQDDRFDIVDHNAAEERRSRHSLSGGETFLASLALALALAEMVSRGGGRLDSFFLDEGFGSLDPEHLDRAMDGIGHLVSDRSDRLVVLVSHVEQMKQEMEDLIVLDKDPLTGDTVVLSGSLPGAV